jgi:hypothetical protein
MATEFSRLYRELCHSFPHDLPQDIGYTRERKQVLKTLGYDVHINEPKIVVPAKHHGKAARRKIPEARLKAISVESHENFKNQRKIKAMTVKTQQVHELTSQIQGLMSQNKFVSKNLWSKYDKIYGTSSHDDKIGDKKADVASPTRCAESFKRDSSVIRSDFSKYKWTKSERDRLNVLYFELEKPANGSVGAWDVYYEGFASRFLITFPHRDKQEVIEKIQEMYAVRHFKEKGEIEYWKSIKT